MRDKNINTHLKSKIAIGYLLIFIASAFAVLFLYKGIKNLQLLDRANTSPNIKLYKINKIVTLIYEAENQTRSYFLFRNKSSFEDYVKTIKRIEGNIDSLTFICKDNPEYIRHLTTIHDLLVKKKDFIKQFMNIKNPSRRDLLYARALDEVYVQAYEISKLPKIIQKQVTVKRDSFVDPPEKRSFMQRFKNLFSEDDEKNRNRRVVIEQSTKMDTVIREGITPDTLVKTLQQALLNLKLREDYLQGKSENSETQLLYNDRVLLDKIREIATLLETEELKSVSGALTESSSILHKASYMSVVLGIISLLVIVIFLVLIFRDISMSRLYQQALQAAKQQAEELMKLKEQFLANMSHEIRTPLGTIIGFTEQLQKTNLASTQKQYVETIDKASAHLLGVVNDILDLSKIEAGKIKLEKVRLHLPDLIEEVCQAFSIKAKEKNIVISSQVSHDLNRELMGDPFRIRQVLINIVGNALKFTHQGSINVEAHTHFRSKICVVAKISVSDTGIGIPPEKQKEIFDDFSQADAGTSRKYGGTGLGLAISKRLIELHDGNITLKSEMGKGSTFMIELPFDIPSQPVTNLPISKDISEDSFSYVKRLGIIEGKKIMVVEDDEITLLLISSLLKNIGIEADIVADSSKAIDLLLQKHFDLVLTDIHMPNMSGIELLHIIRSHADPRINQLPVVALTANVTGKEEIIKTGFNDYLSKPFREAAFYNKIMHMFDPAHSYENTDSHKLSAHSVESAPYSLVEIDGFTGGDPKALHLIVSTFVEKSRLTIEEIKQLVNKKDVEGISFRAHRLLPSFRQFRIYGLVPDLEKLERYKDIHLKPNEFLANVGETLEKAERVLTQIEKEVVLKKEE
jgi:signal transduction histidine kinase/FixJ family two-component response regulator